MPTPPVAEPYPSWTETSRKRGRTFEDTKSATAAASAGRVHHRPQPPQPKSKFNPKPTAAEAMMSSAPGSSIPSHYHASSSSSPPPVSAAAAVGPSWAEMKHQREEAPNSGHTHALMEGVTSIFIDIAEEMRHDPSETGPSILWHILPAVMEAMEKTPLEYYRQRGFIVEGSPLTVVISATRGDLGQTLSSKQLKYRMVILGKVKAQIGDFLKGYFATDNISVVYTTKYFDNEPYVPNTITDVIIQ